MYHVEFLNTIFLVEKTVSFRQFPAFIYRNCLSVWSAKCWDYGALPYSALWWFFIRQNFQFLFLFFSLWRKSNRIVSPINSINNFNDDNRNKKIVCFEISLNHIFSKSWSLLGVQFFGAQRMHFVVSYHVT